MSPKADEIDIYTVQTWLDLRHKQLCLVNYYI